MDAPQIPAPIREKDLIPDDTILADLPVSALEGARCMVEDPADTFTLYQYAKGSWRQVTGVTVTLDTITGGPLSIAKGGTGQNNATSGFNALSPANTKGDIISHNGTNNVRKAVGTNGKVLIADSGESDGLKWVSGGRIGVGYSDNAIISTTSETDLLNVTVPGGSLGTNGVLWMRINFDNFRASNTITLRGYYGTTAMCSTSIASTNGQTLVGHIDFFIYGADSTGTQDGYLELVGDITGYQITADSCRMRSDGTATENSTTDLAMKVTIQFATSGTTDKITFRNGHAVKYL